MPQVLTRKRDRRAQSLAERTVARVELADSAYLLALGDLFDQLELSAGRDDDDEANQVINNFLTSVTATLVVATLDVGDRIREDVSTVYGYDNFRFISHMSGNDSINLIAELDRHNMPAEILRSSAADEYARLTSRLNSLVADGKSGAKLRSSMTGMSYARALSTQALGRADAYNFRKQLNAASLSVNQHEMWLLGQGLFDKKQVAGVSDEDQTALCRRLDGTVWDWNEPVVDPVSGGKKMFAPFIGAPFNPEWHLCRTVVVPYRP